MQQPVSLALSPDTGARRRRHGADARACAFGTASDPIDPFGTRFDAPMGLLAQRLAGLVCAETAPAAAGYWKVDLELQSSLSGNSVVALAVSRGVVVARMVRVSTRDPN